MGTRFFDAAGNEFVPVGGTLSKIARIDNTQTKGNPNAKDKTKGGKYAAPEFSDFDALDHIAESATNKEFGEKLIQTLEGYFNGKTSLQSALGGLEELFPSIATIDLERNLVNGNLGARFIAHESRKDEAADFGFKVKEGEEVKKTDS